MRRLISLTCFLVLVTGPAAAQKVLFDARHGQTAGEADWIVDADTSQLRFLTFRCQPNNNLHHSAQRVPTPPQSEIQLDTPETFWEGAISAWGVALAKDALNPSRGRNWQIEQYAWDAPPMTFGDNNNPQDLSSYDVLILAEPNTPYTDAEAEAILRFVETGGGLFLIADHETSDRDCSGGPNGEKEDSPFILNRLMRTRVQTDPSPPYFDPTDPDNDFGVFGIWFHENGNDDPEDDQNKEFDWFGERANNNVETDPADPITSGPFGRGLGGLGFFGSTQMAISTDPDKGNFTVRAHAWRNGQTHTPLPNGVSERVTFASATFGQGRVVAIGDSSPAEDDTGQGDVHPGWDKALFGVTNHIIFLNATDWLAGDAEPDTTEPLITQGPAADPGDCHARITFSTDESTRAEIHWGETAALAQSTPGTGLASRHEIVLSPLEPATSYSYEVAATDAAGNGPTRSQTQTFTTGARQAPQITGAPIVSGVTDRAATIAWESDKPGTSVVRFGTTSSLDRDERSTGGPATRHSVTLTGLNLSTVYQFRVETADACGEVVQSAIASFTTSARPATHDLSGWKLATNNAAFTFTFPAGTEIPANGYLVVGRRNDRAAFEAEWGPLPEGAVYLDSGDKILINNTARPYRLLDVNGAVVDGPTADVRSGKSRRRANGCNDATSAWGERNATEGDPGRGAPAACGAGVILTELTDGRAFNNEFVEVYFDAGNQ